ncbi:MAG: ribose 5-phosphate isomerase B [Clostridiales Family XIII bacterium]|jgi:ribose 5-phosphate isomerase B|nr:ribose 5-phosphate isomerase B [Clostridiales Family XIII bacterium]
MRIAVAADHGGFALKEFLKEHLALRGIEILDLGTFSEESVDYPLYGKACGEAVISGEADKGLLCCGTGIGISIAANKVKGIRCAVCACAETAELAKRHNDANIISIGARTTTAAAAAAILDAWLDAEFEGGRHQRRVDMLNNM